MHLEKRTYKSGTKYYLAHSFREGRKVNKIRKYLGANLSSDVLSERRKTAEKYILEEIKRYRIISDPLTTVLSDREIEFVRRLESRIPAKIYHLSEEQWTLFSRIFTYNTNAIEGSRLNSKEVNEILERDKWPDKSKEDIAEAYGVNDAIRFIRKTPEHVSVALIKKIHLIVFKNSKPFAGRLRMAGEEVVVVDGTDNIVHRGAPQSRITCLLNELVRWYEKNKNRYPALLLAAVVHNQFENIHPFRDGNGRVGRILLNNILIKHGLPPVNIGFKNRTEYYAALQAYEKNHDIKPTINLFMKEYNSLKESISRQAKGNDKRSH
ncbi:MAG: Fic family protein [Thermoplasmata archaeon]